MEISEEKRALRLEVKNAEKQLSPQEKAAGDAVINELILSTPEYRAAQTVFAFVGTAREIDTTALLKNTLCSGKRLCVPLCREKGQMELKEIRSLSQLHPGAYGILEPSEELPSVSPQEVDLAVIPCASGNRRGHRLGKGGGYYDRFFTYYHGAGILLCREKLLRSEIPMEPHDISLPVIITEAGIFRL